jgi:hypothetical protein
MIMILYPSRTLSISIAQPYQTVYNFICEPDNMHLWADGLHNLNFEDGDWVIDTPKGKATIQFSVCNSFGIVDHYVRLPDGFEIYIPLRVIENGHGADVVFTLFHHSSMSFDEFERDAIAVEKDLRTLKTILENKHD